MDLNLSEEICANLSSNKSIQSEVQKEVATVSMYLQIILAIPAIITSLFLGPWSDRNGRKPLMVIPMIGTIVSQLFYMANTYFTHWSSYYILLTCTGSLFGGFTAFLIGIYSYVSDISGNRSRTSRIAFLDLFVFLGFPVGTYLSGPVFKYGGYYGVFGSVSWIFK